MDILEITDRIHNSVKLGESQFREFKSCFEGSPSNKKPRNPKLLARDVAETLVAFANADGGELLLGVEDNDNITGLPYDEETILNLGEIYKDAIHPDTPLTGVTHRVVQLGNVKILYFTIDKSTRIIHQTSDGRCLQRQDTDNIPISAVHLQFEREEQLSREYDRQFVDGAKVSHLDISIIKNISQQITRGMSAEKCLQYLDLAEYSAGQLRLRKAALLLFARNISHWHPRCQVRIARVRGIELLTGKDYNITPDETTTGNIIELIPEAWEKLRPHLVETKMSPEGIFRERVMYPEDACREALINAIAHRNYAVEGQNIEIYVFDDRMEIHSPGPLLSTIKVSELMKLKGIHESRNAFIARVLRMIGYVREMGEGMRRMFLLMRDADLVSPELTAEFNSFTVTLRYKSVFSEDDQRWLDGFQLLRLTREERIVMLLGKNGEPISPQQIYDRLNLVDWDIYRAIIEQMQTKGLIYNALSELQKKRQAKQRRISQRLVPRIVVHQPTECEKALVDLFGVIHSIIPMPSINTVSMRKMLESLSKDNIYSTNVSRLIRLLGLIGLIDENRQPTFLMRILWGRRIPRVSDVVEKQDQLRYKPSIQFKTPLGQKITRKSTNKIFIGNADYDTSTEELKEFFEQCGNVISVSLPNDYITGRGRGFGFVTMSSHEEAEDAIQRLNGQQFRGRILRLEWDHAGE